MQFSKFAQNSPNSDIHMKQVSHPPFLGIVDDKKWCPFFYSGVQRPNFAPEAIFSDLGCKKIGLRTPEECCYQR